MQLSSTTLNCRLHKSSSTPRARRSQELQTCSDCTRLNTQVCTAHQELNKGGELERVLKYHHHVDYVLSKVIMYFMAQPHTQSDKKVCAKRKKDTPFLFCNKYILKKEQFLNITVLCPSFHPLLFLP